MKNYLIKYDLVVLCLLFLLLACSDDEQPIPVNEEEVITTMTITLIPIQGGTQVVLQTRDLDGDGPNPPVIMVSNELSSGQVYNGTIELLNETESPAGDITQEVQDEAVEHQFFYLTGGNLDLDISYSDQDGNGQPVGLSFTLTTGSASSGTFTTVLRHEPDKDGVGVSDGDITNAGGETDISADFQLEIL